MIYRHTTDAGQTCFYIIFESNQAQTFSKEDKVCSIYVQQENHIPKSVLICALFCLDHAHNMDSKLEVWQMYVTEETQTITAGGISWAATMGAKSPTIVSSTRSGAPTHFASDLE